MGKKALRLMSTVMVIFFVLLMCGSSMAYDSMSWSPRTPAGGAYVGDSNFWIRQAVMAKWGSEVFFMAPTKSKSTNSTTSVSLGGDRRYGTGYALDDQGNVILFNFKNEQIEKKDDEVVSVDTLGRYFYFTPQTSHVTTTQIYEVSADKP
jgi:hypothetical protein